MNRKERIISLLTEAFSPDFLDLIDESAKHSGHAGAAPGGETHYKLGISTEIFKGMGKVQRHQAVYKVLDKEFQSGLHALSITAKATGEA